MSELEDLKVNTPDINKIKNELVNLWTGLQMFGLNYTSKNTDLSLQDMQIVKELFIKYYTKENLKEKIESDLGNEQQLKSRLYTLVTRVKEKTNQNKELKIENIIVGELHHIVKEDDDKSKEIKIYGE